MHPGEVSKESGLCSSFTYGANYGGHERLYIGAWDIESDGVEKFPPGAGLRKGQACHGKTNDADRCATHRGTVSIDFLYLK